MENMTIEDAINKIEDQTKSVMLLVNGLKNQFFDRNCPKCQFLISPSYQYCPRCGFKL